MKNSTLLTVPQAAAVIGVTPDQVRRLIRAGRLPATRFGAAYQVAAAAAANFQRRPRGRPKGPTAA